MSRSTLVLPDPDAQAGSMMLSIIQGLPVALTIEMFTAHWTSSAPKTQEPDEVVVLTPYFGDTDAASGRESTLTVLQKKAGCRRAVTGTEHFHWEIIPGAFPGPGLYWERLRLGDLVIPAITAFEMPDAQKPSAALLMLEILRPGYISTLAAGVWQSGCEVVFNATSSQPQRLAELAALSPMEQRPSDADPPFGLISVPMRAVRPLAQNFTLVERVPFLGT